MLSGRPPERASTNNFGWALREEGDRTARRHYSMCPCWRAVAEETCTELPHSVLGLACLAGDWERWHKAALQHGTDKAFFEQIAQPVLDPEARYRSDS